MKKKLITQFTCETNLLSLVSPWFDNNCQIQTKMLQYSKYKAFRSSI